MSVAKLVASLILLAFALQSEAKTFQNSYISFDVPNNWNCLQEGVAWTCTPQNPTESKEAVIVLAAKVAGPEDNLGTFLNYLKQPKKVATKIGTPMPSQVMYAQQRTLASNPWIQAQHLGSEIQDYYTLYLATVKDQLAILVSFSAEKSRYQVYNPIFDRAMKTLRIVANQKLLFPKGPPGSLNETIGIQVGHNPLSPDEVLPPPERRKTSAFMFLLLAMAALAAAVGYYFFSLKKTASNKGKSASKTANRKK